ncbi:GNAT family N-acetyltransferase [Methylovirgula sp. 4M-Z18]|uniref:GNAT family N-acetyltransferase n=1 Tax=Methylovirgula sp. 4M-Z18 TaxID=2293567 RepID=UPI000E2F6D5F|nr:GNAT family protein [Methylovirgula sp. 4M-Z18]RFB81287.1 N-acetyltransferase [Methylovirgula sp. 4M-Z18]
MDLSSWKGVPPPHRVTLEGRYARLEPLDARRHSKDLFASAREPGGDDRFRYLFDEPPAALEEMTDWLEAKAASSDPLFFAVIDKATGRAEGRQALMRIDPSHGAAEIGNILWGPSIARTRVATEALYLFAHYLFDTLGYRRFEWKCHNLNEPSKRAALRFGFTFEGIFRQHMVAKGRNRDTAWYAMIDPDWPRLRAGYEAWLDPSNFDDDKVQRRKLLF